MSASDQRSACQQEAFNLLKLADQYHEEARATVAPGPRIDKYHDASRHYEMASQRFERCLADVATDMERRRLLGWQEFSIAMQYANIADEKHLMPDPDKRALVDATRTALDHLTEAQNFMPWGYVDKLIVRTKWRVLENSIKGLMYRAEGETLEAQGQLKLAVTNFRQTAESYSAAAMLAQSIGDQVGFLRYTSRSWRGKSDALRCQALVSSKTEKARLLKDAEETARWAATLRPAWAPYQHVLEKLVSLRREHEDITGIRRAWVQVFLGFVLGFLANILVTILFKLLGH
jgi:hypothetical protein